MTICRICGTVLTLCDLQFLAKVEYDRGPNPPLCEKCYNNMLAHIEVEEAFKKYLKTIAKKQG